MSIFDFKEHFHTSDFKIAFKHLVLKKDEKLIFENVDSHCFLFLLKGNIRLSIGLNNHILNTNEMCQISCNKSFKIIAQTNVSIIINNFHTLPDVRERSVVESLANLHPKTFNWSILEIRSSLVSFLESLTFALRDGISCKYFYEIKQKELFFMLQFYYTKEELTALFAMILTNDFNFETRVLNTYKKVHSINELATELYYSISTFRRKFKEVFKENPNVWFQKQRIEYILMELSDKNTSLSEIIEKFGFSSAAHFTIYCKKHTGKTPTLLRKELEKNFRDTYIENIAV